jgi:RNA polymerase sigma-70 factor (ECF subfamily)
MKSASVPASKGFDAARLIEQHQVGVWRYLRALGCEAALADDLTQETFLAVLRQPFDDYSPAATATYLRRTAYNLYVTLQRRQGRVLAVEDLEQLDRTWMRWAGRDQGEALLEALRDCLSGLTERARLALELRYRDRSSRAGIAERLQISEHGVKNLMQRAKQKLRACIESKLE